MSKYRIEFEVQGGTLNHIKREAKAEVARLLNLENSAEALRPYPIYYDLRCTQTVRSADGKTIVRTYTATVTVAFEVFPVLL